MGTGFTKILNDGLGIAVAASAAVALALFSGSAPAQTPSFTLITPGLNNNSTVVNGLSSDGTAVVGQSGFNFGDGFYWTQAGGRTDLRSRPGVPEYTNAYASSDHARVIVGVGGPTSTSTKAFKYSNGVYQQLQTPSAYLRSSARGVSGDGSLIVGSVLPTPGFPVPAKWNASGVLQELGFANPGDSYGGLTGVSRDGSLAYGQSGGGTGNTFEAVTWSPTDGWRTLPPVPGVSMPYNALPGGCSADGRYIAGDVLPSIGLETAVLWRDGVAISLPPLIAGRGAGAGAVTDDGNMVLGGCSAPGGVIIPTIWINQSPIRISDFYSQNGVPVTQGWTIRTAGGVSGDGRIFTGTAIGPDGFTQLVYVATIPQPGPLALVGLTGSALAFRRRRGVR